MTTQTTATEATVAQMIATVVAERDARGLRGIAWVESRRIVAAARRAGCLSERRDGTYDVTAGGWAMHQPSHGIASVSRPA